MDKIYDMAVISALGRELVVFWVLPGERLMAKCRKYLADEYRYSEPARRKVLDGARIEWRIDDRVVASAGFSHFANIIGV